MPKRPPKRTVEQREEDLEAALYFLGFVASYRLQKLKAKRYAAGVKGWETRRKNKLIRLKHRLLSDLEHPDCELTLRVLE